MYKIGDKVRVAIAGRTPVQGKITQVCEGQKYCFRVRTDMYGGGGGCLVFASEVLGPWQGEVSPEDQTEVGTFPFLQETR